MDNLRSLALALASPSFELTLRHHSAFGLRHIDSGTRLSGQAEAELLT